MKFASWLENRLTESLLSPELDRLKRDERMLLMSIEGRKGPNGAIVGINKAGVIDAMNKLKEVRARIAELEAKSDDKGKAGPIPSWIRDRKVV